MFDLNEFGFQAKKLNAEYLKSLDKPAVKATITGGGTASFKDGTKSPYLTVTSPSGQWEGEKEMILNASNRNILKAVLGAQPGSWIGQEIGVYFDPTVSFGGKPIGGIKVKPFVPDPFATQAQVAAPVSVEADIPF
jgi:hypothetical protein